MAALPYQKIYWADLVIDTMPLNNAQLGAYVRIMAANWINTGLPAEKDAIEEMAGLAPKDFKRLWRFMEPKLVPLEDGQVSIRRTEADLQQAAEVSEAARRAVQARHRRRNVRSTGVDPSTHTDVTRE